MNQILSVEMPKRKSGYYKRNTNKTDIKTIIIFFTIILILFATIIVVVALSIKNKEEKENKQQSNQNEVITKAQPKIDVEIMDTEVNITVSHDKQISYIAYDWNGGEKVEETEIGENSKEIKVQIPQGTNTLNVIAIDIDGVTGERTTEGIIAQGPTINIQRQGNKVNLIVECNKNISYISYNWNGGDEKQIQVNDVKIEELLDVDEGVQTLNVVAVDVDGKDVTQSFTIKGDNEPTLNITTDKVNLILEASDDEELTKMTVEVYGTGETKEFEINDKQFKKTIPLNGGEIMLQDGENRLIITVYNINGIKNVQYKKIYK